jgi:hypothetical protein
LLVPSYVANGQGSRADSSESRFDPHFRNGVHAPREEDAGIVQILRKFAAGGGLAKPRSFSLVHGHFLGDGTETVVATAYWRVPGGNSLATFLFSKDTSRWKLRSRDESLSAAFVE